MLKIYDCSNSSERHKHEKFKLGPKENDIVKDLKYYSKYFGFEFVENVKNCDVIFTNDIFPSNIKNLDKPKVKRCDGIYWNNQKKHLNENLNDAMMIANHNIFISQYSYNALSKLYPDVNLRSYNITLNNSDERVFNRYYKSSKLIFSTTATNWERSEKRFNKLVEFAKNIQENILVIGKIPDTKLPDNIVSIGYIKDYKKLNEILNVSTAHISLSYRDACPKTVYQAIACEQPILYATSGGQSEQIKIGIPIKDNIDINFADDEYDMNINDIMNSYYVFKKDFNILQEKYKFYNKKPYMETLYEYFEKIKSMI